MTDIIIPGFRHNPGIHCGSVAMRGLLAHHGIELSEAMVFGLGSGLGFFYLADETLSPTRQFSGRQMNMEEHIAERLGLKLVAHRTDDPAEGWRCVEEAIDAGYPALIECDLRYLGYWHSRSSFNAHRVLAVGYNKACGEVILADTHFEELQRAPLTELAAARASRAAPVPEGRRHLWWHLEPPAASGDGAPRPVRDVIFEALGANARLMDEEHGGIAGLPALYRMGNEIAAWRERDDAVWCYKFAHQMSELRGTGGGNFRVMYRDYLMEAAELRPEIVQHGLAVSMARTAEAWSTLGRYCRLMSDFLEGGPDAPSEDPGYHLTSLGEAVYQFESTFWDRIEMLGW